MRLLHLVPLTRCEVYEYESKYVTDLCVPVLPALPSIIIWFSTFFPVSTSLGVVLHLFSRLVPASSSKGEMFLVVWVSECCCFPCVGLKINVPLFIINDIHFKTIQFAFRSPSVCDSCYSKRLFGKLSQQPRPAFPVADGLDVV